jgi:hypothetical protein
MIVKKNSSHIVATLHAGFHLRQINMVSVDDQGIRGERWTYRARMEVRHGKADLLVRLKATGRRVHLRALDLNVWHKR